MKYITGKEYNQINHVYMYNAKKSIDDVNEDCLKKWKT